MGASLNWADLSGAKLIGAGLIETNLVDATLTDCTIYGISAWNVKLNERTKQRNLIITPVMSQRSQPMTGLLPVPWTGG